MKVRVCNEEESSRCQGVRQPDTFHSPTIYRCQQDDAQFYSGDFFQPSYASIAIISPQFLVRALSCFTAQETYRRTIRLVCSSDIESASGQVAKMCLFHTRPIRSSLSPERVAPSPFLSCVHATEYLPFCLDISVPKSFRADIC